MKRFYILFALIPLFFLSNNSKAQCTSCDPTVTTFVVDLSASADTVWTTSSTRNGHCCGATGSTNCIRFEVTVNPNTTEIGFNVQNPSPPGGAFYQVDCGPQTSLGTPLCVTGMTSFCITFCKSGGDSPTYTISASQSFAASPDIAINSNCNAELSVTGLDESSISWNSIAPGNTGDYNSYLSCIAACDSTTVTPQAGYPTYIDYEVTGTPVGCAAGTSKDTVRVYINDGISANITPNPALVCFGASDAVITANATGGAPPYSYNWNTGETTQSITVGAGTYWVAVSDTTSGCPSSNDTVIVTNSAGPITADAGTDQIVCSTSPSVTLAGVITEAQGGVWTGGTGTFSPNDSTLNATYTPSAAEISAGTVNLTLTSYGNGGCTGASDAMIITIQQAPTVSAGTDIALCEGETATLAGTVTGGAGTGTWTSSGSGTFSPNASTLNAVYTPSTADISSGSVILTLSATASCAPVSDQITVTITPIITTTAGADQLICQGSTVSLNGSVTGGSTTGNWTSSGTGTFSPSSTTLNATYTPSAADISSGNVTLTLTSTNNGGCSPSTDNLMVTIQQNPVAAAGSDIAICEGDPVNLSGTITGGAGTGTWTTSGTGTFSPSAADLNATYNLSAADISSGNVTITLTATNSCSPAADQLTLYITPLISVAAGADQAICEGDNVSLSGSVTGGSTTGTWTTSGTGSFSNPSALNATYTPSSADATSGTVTLTLTSTNNGNCGAVTDDVIVTITPLPVVSAGSDQNVCESDVITLNGSVTVGSTTGTWTTSGTGTFSANASTLNATYNPSATDVSSGSVTLTLSSTGGCQTITDQVVINITPLITVNAGTDQLLCIGTPVSLNGSVTGGSTTGTWTSSGTGIFSNPNALNATYTPSAADNTSGSITLTITSTNNASCSASTDDMIVTIQPNPTASAGSDISICEGDPVNLSGSITGGAGTGIWSTSGTGTFAPSATDFNATYTPSAADISSGNITLTISATNACAPISDQLTLSITPAILVNAGTDQIVCEGDVITLGGSISGGTTTGTWTSSGTGSFSNPSALNATYTPSPTDISNGTVTFTLTSINNGNCGAVTDDMVSTITPLPVVDAGADQNICQGNSASLAGSVTVGSTSGTWTTSGSGTFSSATDLNATYTPSAADVTAGTVILTLTSTGGCQNITDQLTLSITPLPVVNAGSDQTVCGNNSNVSLSGSVTVGGSAGTWTTTGTGTFTPSANDLNATYVPSAADTTVGTVDLTLTSTDGCSAVSDGMTITITGSPIVYAGSDLTMCANNNIAFSGSVSGPTTTGVWSTSGTGSFSSTTDLNAIYTPSAADTTAGSVNITLTSTNNGSCSAEIDQMLITITPAPNVNAGLDETVCANNSLVSLNGSVSAGATNGIWTTSGNGTFSPSNTDFNAQYTPGSNDILNGSATLTLTSTNNGNCLAESDQVTITVTPAPIVDAGADQIVCDNAPDVNLSGSVTGGTTTGIWISSGTGTFSPSNTDLNATYSPSAADISSGNLTLVLQSTGNGNCNMESDTLLVTITTAPTVDAGIDVTMCANNVVNLSGQVNGFTTTGIWSTTGTGTFTPSATDLNATYSPSSADTTNGNVSITLTSTNNSSCIAVTDNLTINFTPAPIVDAGADLIVCSNNAVANLSGNVSGASSTGQWTTLGTGTFSLDTDLNADYILSNSDTTNGGTQLVLTATNIGNCLVVSDTLAITLIAPPSVDAGVDQFVCLGNTAPLSGVITNGSGTGIWSTSGTGTFAPSNTDLNATYTPSASDESNGSVELILASTNNGNCFAVEDTLVLTFVTQPTVNTGTDITICSSDSAQLAGSVSGSSTTGIWTTSGDGSFSPSDTDLNAQYIPGVNDIANGTVTLDLESTNSCYNNDQVTVTINPGPTVDAGADQIICNTDTQVNLSGIVGGITSTGEWTSTGTGSFTPASSDLNATYNLTQADSSAGQFYLILTTTGNGVCSAAFDSVAVTMTTVPVVNAGNDTTFCANNMGILNGSVTGGASSGIWTSSGTGTFAPSDTDLNATYLPSDADTTNGIITLTLTSTGACIDITDDVILNITPGPMAFAGNDTTICNSATLQLAGYVTGASTTGEWFTSGDGSFAPSTTDLNAVYTPGANDIANGNFELYLSPTNIADCLPVEDTIAVSIQYPPTANAGNDLISCASSSVAISGSISGGSSGSWATTGSGTFSSSNLNTDYLPSSADTTAGSVNLILSSDPAGLCGQDSDTLTIMFIDQPVVDAGIDQSVCGNNDSTFVSGTTSNGSGIWSTNGDGTFVDSDSLLTNTYLPGSSDSINGSVELYLTSANTQNCPLVTDTLVLTITPAPQVDAGSNISVCTNNLLVSLSGSITGGSTTGYWTTTGTGTFIPDSLSLGTNYQPSSADTTSGSIQFVLTSTNNGNCYAESDSLVVTFDAAPVLEAGVDQSICQSDTAILAASVNGGGTVTWTSAGNGTIIAINDTLSQYIPAPEDTIAPFEVYASYTNGCGTLTDTLILTVLPSPGLVTSFDVNCETFEVQFDASTSNSSIASIIWDFGDGNTDTISNPMNQYASDGSYTVSVEVTTTQGCSDQSTFNVTIVPLPIADFVMSDSVINTGGTIFFNDTSQNAVSWTWDFGDGGGTFNVEDTTYGFNQEGTYTVLLTVANQSGCTDTAQASITVESDLVETVLPPAIPNAFSPNNDSHNDLLLVRGGPFVTFNFRVFNEWGNLVFSSDDQAKGWNGFFKGKLQPVGVYVFTFEGTDVDGNEYSISGDITLIR